MDSSGVKLLEFIEFVEFVGFILLYLPKKSINPITQPTQQTDLVIDFKCPIIGYLIDITIKNIQ